MTHKIRHYRHNGFRVWLEEAGKRLRLLCSSRHGLDMIQIAVGTGNVLVLDATSTEVESEKAVLQLGLVVDAVSRYGPLFSYRRGEMSVDAKGGELLDGCGYGAAQVGHGEACVFGRGGSKIHSGLQRGFGSEPGKNALIQVLDAGFLASRQFGVVGHGFDNVLGGGTHPLYTYRKGIDGGGRKILHNDVLVQPLH